MISGIFTPNLVPFNERGIHEDELRRMTNWLIEKGISGLYPNGSTGEFITMRYEERKRIITIIAQENRDRVPILAGASEPNLESVLDACQTYADLGCTAVSVMAPYYYKISQASIEHYFRTLAQRSPIDIILYNIPIFANEISVPVITRLALECPRIVGVKDSSRDFPKFLNILNSIKPQRQDFSCLIGCEEMLMPSLIMGADGGVMATSGVVPEAVMRLYHEFVADHWQDAKRIQLSMLDLINTMLFGASFPQGFREGMIQRGFRMGPSRQLFSPHERINPQSLRAKIERVLIECGFSDTLDISFPEKGLHNK